MATFVAIRNAKQTRGAMAGAMGYVAQDEKTQWRGISLVAGHNCVPQSSYIEFLTTKKRFHKMGGPPVLPFRAIFCGGYTLGQWMRVWYENYATIKVRPSSHATYMGIIKNHIDHAIGDIPLTKLTTLDLQKFYRDLLAGGRVERKESEKKPKGLGPKTVRNIHQIISSALQLAIHQKLIPHNPAEGCALPRVERNEMKTLTADQLTAFLQEAKRTGVFEMYYLELATGLRRGELLGLKWPDVDFHQGTITVRRQISRINGQVVEAPLKTKNAYRVIPLGEQALAVLQSQQEKTHSEYVFPSPNGGPISPDSVRNMLRRVLKRAGLPYVRFHDLRHPYVKPTTKKFLSFFKFEMAISLRAFLCFALLLGIKEGPQLVPFIR